MSTILKRVATSSFLLALLQTAWSAPANRLNNIVPTTTTHAPSSLVIIPASATVSPAPEDPNEILWTPNDNDVQPEPMRGPLGSNILGSQNVPIDLENADLLAPPSTDAGTV